MRSCDLCRSDLGPLVATGRYWWLILNRNQNLLGKCFWTLNRHLERVAELNTEEWIELHGLLAATTQALSRVWQPDHFNLAFLQNQDRHVHLHVIPRYAAARTAGRQVFTDPDYPGHYAVGGPGRLLPPAHLERLAMALTEQFRAPGDQAGPLPRCP